MSVLMASASTLAGLLLLAFASDRFVLAAARLAQHWGLSLVLIGAVIVGMGTSAPELLVSVLAAAAGETDLALGNVVGSNIANVTLILGSAALFAPVYGDLKILRREGVLMLVTSLLLVGLTYDLLLSRVEGLVLLLSIIPAGVLMVWWARQDPTPGGFEAFAHDPAVRVGKELVLGLLGLGGTLLGAQLLVMGATSLATTWGLSSAFIGLTIVAIGTSLPELATSIASIRRGQHDLVIGNVLGSNICNSLLVAGSAATVSPGALDGDFRVATGMMLGAAVVAGLLATTGRKIARWEGLVLLLAFVGFIYSSL